jgi:hypothetical protein
MFSCLEDARGYSSCCANIPELSPPPSCERHWTLISTLADLHPSLERLKPWTKGVCKAEGPNRNKPVFQPDEIETIQDILDNFRSVCRQFSGSQTTDWRPVLSFILRPTVPHPPAIIQEGFDRESIDSGSALPYRYVMFLNVTVKGYD